MTTVFEPNFSPNLHQASLILSFGFSMYVLQSLCPRHLDLLVVFSTIGESFSLGPRVNSPSHVVVQET